MNFNQVILAGRLVNDPELKTFESGSMVCKFRLATNSFYKDKKKAEFNTVEVWNKVAENCSKYLKKGSAILVVGRLDTDVYEDGVGKTQYFKKIVANTIQFGAKSGSKSDDDSEDSPEQAPNEMPPLDDIPF